MSRSRTAIRVTRSPSPARSTTRISVPGGHRSCRWRALLAGDDTADLLRRDCEARAAVGDEGDGDGADDREDVGKGRGAGGLCEGGDGVFDVAEVEPLANEVRHGGGGRDG